MPLENLTISRVCLHEVHRLNDAGNVVNPTYATGLLQLDARALEAFRARTVAAFKSNAQCMEMSIRQFSPASVVAVGSTLHALQDPEYVLTSRHFADSLAAVQTSRAIPGGLVVIFHGTVGHPAMPYFAIMKAELHEGFLKTNNLQAQFVSDLFLSPKTKLYKIGIFISDGTHPAPALPAGWRPIVYDSSMTATQRDAAATYFYSAFLGLEIPVVAAQQVKQFFEKTKAFIAASNLDQERKVDLFNGLYSYLKVDQGPTIQVSQFADRYMATDMADEYANHMRQQSFPNTAIAKDLSEVSGALKLRRFKFPRAISLAGPPDAIRDLVSVAPLLGDNDEQWTQITIRGRIESQE